LYSWEIQEFIKKKNGILTPEESKVVNNIRFNPQLNHIVFHPFANKFDLWDEDGNYFTYQIAL